MLKIAHWSSACDATSAAVGRRRSTSLTPLQLTDTQLLLTERVTLTTRPYWPAREEVTSLVLAELTERSATRATALPKNAMSPRGQQAAE
eukprot:scaffold1973_cov399-Prasinococcus_capsulatus_cf.AAC.4